MKKTLRWVWVAVSIIGLLKIIGYLYPLMQRHHRLTAAIGFAVACLGMLYFSNLVRRYHQRIVGDLYANHLKIVQRISRLSDAGGYASKLDRDCDRKESEVSDAEFKYWAGLLQNALSDSDCTSWNPESLKVPEPHKRYLWFQGLRERLSAEISRQIQLIEQAKKDHEKLGS